MTCKKEPENGRFFFLVFCRKILCTQLKKVLDLLVIIVLSKMSLPGVPVANRGIAQLVEHRSPKPGVVSSNLTAPANKKPSNRTVFLLAIWRG